MKFKLTKMKKIIAAILPILFVLVQSNILAQQNSLFNAYSLDPLQLNIAYAGATCAEANAHYRTQWVGLKDAPKLIQLNAHTALGKTNNALGFRVNSQTQGLLNTLGATIGYAYRIKVCETAKIHLGLGVGFTQAAFLSQKVQVVDGNDVTLNNNNRQVSNGFDSEAGVMFVGYKFKAGVSVLHLYNSNPTFVGTGKYKTLPQLNTQLSYTFNKDKRVEIEPWLLNRYTISGDNVIEGMINFNFVKTIVVGAGYRTNYGVISLLGAKIGNVKLAYSFDYGTTKNKTNIGSSHQVMLGFSLCKNTKTPKPIEAPVVVTPTVTSEPIKEIPVIEELKKEEIVVKETPVTIAPTAINNEKQLTDINKFADEVIFDLNKSVLNSDALASLDKISMVLKANPDLKIKIVGHTCNIGSKEQNELLAFRRANYVRNELIKRGVKETQIEQIVGVAPEVEIYDNNTKNKLKNRTVRFVEVK